jgi:hypothetical protein
MERLEGRELSGLLEARKGNEYVASEGRGESGSGHWCALLAADGRQDKVRRLVTDEPSNDAWHRVANWAGGSFFLFLLHRLPAFFTISLDEPAP